MNLFTSSKLCESPKVRRIDGHPGYFSAQLTDNVHDSLHFTRRQLTAWVTALLGQVDVLERDPLVVAE